MAFPRHVDYGKCDRRQQGVVFSFMLTEEGARQAATEHFSGEQCLQRRQDGWHPKTRASMTRCSAEGNRLPCSH